MMNDSAEICTDNVDWLEPSYTDDGEQIEGMPLEPFLNPDFELRTLLGSLTFKVVKKTRINGMPEVQIYGNKKDD